MIQQYMEQNRRKEILPQNPVTFSCASLDSIKPQAYKYLQNNQQKFWKRFLYAMLQRLHYTFQKKSSATQDINSWITDSIDNSLIQLAIPTLSPKISEVCEKYNSEKRQWEKTFQKMLAQEKNNKLKFQEQLADLHEEYRSVKQRLLEQKKDVGKLMVRYGVNGPIDWVRLVNVLGSELESAKEKIAYLEEQQTCLTDNSEKLKLSGNQNTQISAIISKSSHVNVSGLSNSILMGDSIIKGTTEAKTQILENFDQIDQESCLQIQSDVGDEKNKQLLELQKKTIQTAQILKQNAMVQAQIQDQEKEKERKCFLLRMTHLEKQIQEKNERIQELSQSKEQIIKIARTKIDELQNEVDLGVKLFEQKSQQLSDLQHEFDSTVKKYKNFAKQYLSLKETSAEIQVKMPFQKQKGKKQNTSIQCKKCLELQHHFIKFIRTEKQGGHAHHMEAMESQDEESLDAQSEEMELKSKYIEKASISKYLIRYMELEINNGRKENKVSTLLQAVQVLNPNQEQQEIIEDYSRKMNLLEVKSLSSSIECESYNFSPEEQQ